MDDTDLTNPDEQVSRFPKYDTAVSGFQNYWYPVMFSRKLRRKPVPFTLLGRKIVLVRDQGNVHALQDRCPHRGIPLSAGVRLSRGTITCPYHGWTYELKSGKLVAVLTDVPDSGICGKANVMVYPVEERAGLIWVYVGTGNPPPVEVDIPADLLSPDIVILGRAKEERGNWRLAAENGIDEAHARFLHRTGIWTLLRGPVAWTKFENGLSNESEPWLIRTYHEVKSQDQYPYIGVWPRKRFWQFRRSTAREIGGRLPCILRNGSPGRLMFYNWWVPMDENRYLRLMTMTLHARGLKALGFRLWFWLFARWARLILFSNQDLWMVELTQTPPERLFRPDSAIIAWRKYCEQFAREP
jgi:phenylpropionate dioxygenase-like ring-hydroxylating dioxygenase large terminal subunit